MIIPTQSGNADILAVGIQPVGVADITGYNNWVKIPIALSPDTVDVGTCQAPSLEAIAGLNPDLIITAASLVGENYDKLSVIAPTPVFDAYPTDENLTHYQVMIAKLRREQGATLVGRWSANSCAFDGSLALKAGMFLGLALDDNQKELTDDRTQSWVQ